MIRGMSNQTTIQELINQNITELQRINDARLRHYLRYEEEFAQLFGRPLSDFIKVGAAYLFSASDFWDSMLKSNTARSYHEQTRLQYGDRAATLIVLLINAPDN